MDASVMTAPPKRPPPTLQPKHAIQMPPMSVPLAADVATPVAAMTVGPTMLARMSAATTTSRCASRASCSLTTTTPRIPMRRLTVSPKQPRLRRRARSAGVVAVGADAVAAEIDPKDRKAKRGKTMIARMNLAATRGWISASMKVLHEPNRARRVTDAVAIVAMTDVAMSVRAMSVMHRGARSSMHGRRILRVVT